MAERPHYQCPRCGNIERNKVKMTLPPMPKDAKPEDFLPPMPETYTCASCGQRWQHIRLPPMTASQ